MVDAVVSVFLEKLINVLSEETSYVSKYKEQFEKLKNELLLMESFLKDAERVKRKNRTLRTIMVSLRELIFEAEDILADCLVHPENSNIASRYSVLFQSKNVKFRYQKGKRLNEINEKVSRIKENIATYLGVPILSRMDSLDAHNNLMSRWSSPVYDHSEVVGLEGDTEKIKSWLCEASDDGILAIGIVGMGGLGKTTLAQKVFNDKKFEEHFERRIWVSVSQTFTEEQIMRSILRSLGDVSVGDDNNELLKKINQYLLGKRYLIVMDDVWGSDNSWWLRICNGLPKGNGSSVMITTRNEVVARQMGVTPKRTHWPQLLNDDNSWLLFRKIAFAPVGGECTDHQLESLGKEIVEKCKGLPLAIKAIGGVMLCKRPHYPDWRRMSNHFRDEIAENGNSVMVSLQLSYDELPPYLKSCLLCLALFPEDCVIAKEQLISWWIGESFIPLRNSRLSTEVGEDCFSELSNRCLVEVVDKAYSGEIQTCKIHDLIRDLLIKIAKEDAFSDPPDPNTRRLSITTNINGQNLKSNNRLRALLTTTKNGEVNRVSSDVAKSFCNCHNLQVLDVSKSIFSVPLSSLFDEIGSLYHLTYLSLSNTHPLIEIPSSLAKLHNLQILDVSYCQNLKKLPSCIVTLENLVILDVGNCGSLECLPKGIAKLLNLQVLLGFRPARSNQIDGCRIGELRNLTKLRKLGLRLTQADEIGDDELDTLINLEELQYLHISCFDSHEDDNLVLKLDKLVPPRQLHEVSLKFYCGSVSPDWLNPISLPMLQYLSIISGNLTKLNERFWGNQNSVWKIEGLKLEALSDLSEEWAMIQQVMPSLRTLNVSWCPELESFPIEDVGFKGGVWKMGDQRG
ncbi:antimicrobial response protein [Lithospermum erythrorhizon]|uniref:Antimicrobial response protein n=1 Tax=Lithospermum erythrorhizon TaxID=34254 RepID=A0AAV3RZJ1_LITER